MEEQIVGEEVQTKRNYVKIGLIVLQSVTIVALSVFIYFAMAREAAEDSSESTSSSLPVDNDSVEEDAELAAPLSVVVDTNQTKCYTTTSAINCPNTGGFYGQDGNFTDNPPSYKDNGDDTITDLNTGLVWTQQYFGKMTFDEGAPYASTLDVGGYSDWRVPSIKELYSLTDFTGDTGSATPDASTAPNDAVPYIDEIFSFAYGASPERYIDSQWLTTNKYVSTTMNGAETMFGVNFADGRIKGYGLDSPNPAVGEKEFYVRFVRGEVYGVNDFVDNGDKTITDRSVGLMWTQNDSGEGVEWKEALAYCEALDTAEYTDWHLPNVKQLQYIVDYTRSPDTTNSPAIDPLFKSTQIINEAGETDYAFYWTGTTHLDGPIDKGAYVSFGRALGYMDGQWQDVHGAGTQRSDPKSGDASEYPQGFGPQGDAIRIDNYVRCVRKG